MLAAIMFTDMVGYTAMMQENENKAKMLRDKHREVLEQMVQEHHGQILQYYGDGTLVIFGSAIEAAACGARIQTELQKKPEVPLRIGIHAGDIVYDDEGVYGDGVNIASRIENIAIAGSVLISEKVNDELKNQKEISTVLLGRFNLKNVKQPVKLFAVNLPGLVVPSPDQLDGKADTRGHSVAVLPFINLSADKDNEYFSDGMTEEILNALAKVEGLMVTSRTSSFAFKGKNTDVREIARQLGVKSILEGSVRKQGNKVRVTAQLINASDGYHKWSEVYDRNLEDIFAVQDEIALAIALQMKQNFNAVRPARQLVKTATENIDAYNIYLKGSYYWNKWTPHEVNKAIKYFEDAIILCPEFALAYSRLSACYIYLGAVGSMPNKVAYPKAKEYALKAIEIDDSLIDSHLSIGMVKYFNDWDWEEAQKCFLKALEINPNSAETHQYYAMLLMTLGHFKKAVKEAETAQQLDPLNAPISQILAFAYFNLNQVDEAIKQHEKTKEIEPGFKDAWSSLAWIYLKQGEFEEAIELFSEVENIPGFKAKAISGLGYLYAKKGDKEKAADYLKQLEAMNSEELPLDMELAIIHTGLDEMDKVFNYLESAFEKRLGGMNFIKGRYWKEIHEHPRFKNLLQKMKLPEE